MTLRFTKYGWLGLSSQCCRTPQYVGLLYVFLRRRPSYLRIGRRSREDRVLSHVSGQSCFTVSYTAEKRPDVETRSCASKTHKFSPITCHVRSCSENLFLNNSLWALQHPMCTNTKGFGVRQDARWQHPEVGCQTLGHGD